MFSCQFIYLFLKKGPQWSGEEVTPVGKTDAMLTGPGKSQLAHPHSSHPGFAAIFSQTSQQGRFGKNQGIARETPGGMHQNAVGKRESTSQQHPASRNG